MEMIHAANDNVDNSAGAVLGTILIHRIFNTPPNLNYLVAAAEGCAMKRKGR